MKDFNSYKGFIKEYIYGRDFKEWLVTLTKKIFVEQGFIEKHYDPNQWGYYPELGIIKCNGALWHTGCDKHLLAIGCCHYKITEKENKDEH